MHQMEWALERGGRPMMLNPDEPYWVLAFNIVATPGSAAHWSGDYQTQLLAYLMMQRGQWSEMSTAAVEPRGTVQARTYTHDLIPDCGSPHNTLKYRDRKVPKP
jgi:hypothetical protein